MRIDSTMLIKQAEDQVSCPLQEEVAILSLKSTFYYSLAGVGSFVWQQLVEQKSVKDVCASVVDQFDVNVQLCELEIIEFLNELFEAGLIQVSTPSSGS
jgi:hypothetical protein